MKELQRLVPTEKQVKAGLLIEQSPYCFSVVRPDTYEADLRALAASSQSNQRRK